MYLFTSKLNFCCVADINECSESTHNCDINALCIDANGGYTCTCSHGYTGNGTMCYGNCINRRFNIFVDARF